MLKKMLSASYGPVLLAAVNSMDVTDCFISHQSLKKE